MALNPQALELNDAIRSANPCVFDLLSQRGRRIYFPKSGILAQTAEAKGKEFNATIGTALEDAGTPMTLRSLAVLLNLDLEAFSYAPSPGRPEIRSRWKQMMVQKNPSLAGQTFSLPVVTSALTHGLSMAGYLFVEEGDRIITPDLYWENYDLVFGLAYGGVITTYATFCDNKHFNIDGLRERLSAGPVGKKIVILNFPNNPTGYTVTFEEARKIREVLVSYAEAGNDILVLIDDAYFGLVFEEGILKESMFTLLANAHPRILAVKFDGPTKEDYVWGFRVGFVTFGTAKSSPQMYTALEMKLGGAIRGNISNSSNISQALLLRAYENPGYGNEKVEKFRILKRRYEKIRDIFASHPEYADCIVPLPFNSGYFMCVKIQRGDAEAVRQILLHKYGTGVIAQCEVIRIAFSSSPFDQLDRLFHNVYLAAREAASS